MAVPWAVISFEKLMKIIFRKYFVHFYETVIIIFK